MADETPKHWNLLGDGPLIAPSLLACDFGGGRGCERSVFESFGDLIADVFILCSELGAKITEPDVAATRLCGQAFTLHFFQQVLKKIASGSPPAIISGPIRGRFFQDTVRFFQDTAVR